MTIQLIFAIVDILICIALIVVVLSQESASDNLGTLAGQSTTTETFYGKSKGNTKEAKLKRLTAILSILFALVTMVLYVLTR